MVLWNIPAYSFHVDLWWIEAPWVWCPIYQSCIDAIHWHFSVWSHKTPPTLNSSWFSLEHLSWIILSLGLSQLKDNSLESSFCLFDSFYWTLLHSTFCFNNTLAGFLLNNNSYCERKGSKKKYNQKVNNFLPGQYVTQTGMLSASPHHGRQTPSIPLSLLWQDSTRENCISWTPVSISGGINSFTTLWWVETDSHCPPKDAICYIKSIIHMSKTFISRCDQFEQVLGLWWLLEPRY